MITPGSDYHQNTSYDRHSLGGHFSDWANKPDIYKEYTALKTVSLDRGIPMPDGKISRIIEKPLMKDAPGSLSLEKLCQIFALAYPLTSKSHYPGGEFLHRSVPSAGGLYPCELYMSNHSVSGLDDGLYHYAVGRHAIEQLREGNFLERDLLLTFFVTAIFFRSAWKYRDRSYRYLMLDTGHLVENLGLTLKAVGLSFELCYDFDDQKVNHLLGLDTRKEVCLAVVNVLGQRTYPGSSVSEIESLPKIFQKASRVAYQEIDYPALDEIHANTSCVATSQAPLPNMLSNTGPVPRLYEKIHSPDPWPDKMNYAEAVLKRRSMRNFVKKELPRTYFEALLSFLCKADEPDNTVCMGFLAGTVEGIKPGCYWVNRSENSVALIQSGFQMGKMAHICLDQEWLAQAALHFFFVTNLKLLEQTRGPRGYRHAMLTAGRLGQKIYLGATALGLGCCGIGAFYDREASEFLKLNDDSGMLYLVAAGPVKGTPNQ